MQSSTIGAYGQTKKLSERPSSVDRVGPVGGNGDTTPHFDGAVSRGSGKFVHVDALYQQAKTEAGTDGVTLNLVNVPIAQAAKTVLGDILKMNYSISDKVVGNITMQTTSPVPPEVLADAFEAAIKVNGAALVQSQGFYRIIPTAGGVRTGTLASEQNARGGPNTQTQIATLRHISATEMKRLLEPIINSGAILRADDTRSLIIAAGTAHELKEMNKMIGAFDVDWMSGMSVAFYPVKASDPEAVARELETIFGLDSDGPLKGIVRILPNERLESILVISSQPQHLETARDWIEKLDRAAQESEEKLFVYKIQNRAAGELASLLQAVLQTADGGVVSSEEQIAPRYEEVVAASEPAAPLSSTTPSNERVSVDAGPVGPTASVGGRNHSINAGAIKVVADEGNNALVIQAVTKDYDRILRILDRLDALPTQVMLEAVIAEVSLNDELKFGLKWYFEKKHSSFTFSDALSGIVAPSYPGFSYFFSTSNINVAIDAVSSVTKVNVVSAPSLMVMDNKKATLQIGDQVPVITQTAQSVTNPDAPVVNAVTLKDTGVILSVTPRVNDSGRVVLDIEQEVSNVSQTTSSGIDSPTIQQRRVKTTVAVADGEVIALGGLIQQRDETTKGQVPLLGNIPVLGAAFRTKGDTIDRTELVIFLRPVVVRNSEEARDIAEEFQARIKEQTFMPTKDDRNYRRDADRILR